ncbi:ATP-dependent helicase C-terminal domain-containing protein, partial [Proteus terrae]|uniref:ATP-dependent helicase C-terminal domain-containing protein n=1 Tax=Proteus terrae TaxID=1574161 RepID=UPI00301DBB34
LALAKKWCPEALLPDLAETVLLENLETWLLPELGEIQTLKALQQIDINTIIKNQLTWHENQLLQRLFPTHYLAPTGTKVMITYDLESPPVIAIRIQEVYGEQQRPIIANGQLPV